MLRRYRPAYKAFRSDSSFNFMVFFFIFFFQMIILVVQTIGIKGSGYCGFITALYQFDGTPSGIVMGLFLLVIAISFAICTAGNVMLLTKVMVFYFFVMFLFNLSCFFLRADSFDIQTFRFGEHGQSTGWIHQWIYAQSTCAKGCRQRNVGRCQLSIRWRWFRRQSILINW